MLNMIKGVYHYLLQYDPEADRLVGFVHSLLENHNGSVLDVGCGYGRYLKLLQDTGYDVLGVEENEDIVSDNHKHGLNCMSVKEFSQTDAKFDLILMSHIIEHFSPEGLKDFMDDYLDRLKVGGHLIIATPLMSQYFYDDFDHVKPYQPIGIMMVFGSDDAQVQYYSRNKLELKDIWFRKSFYRFSHVRLRYKGGGAAVRLYQVFHLLSASLLYLSRGRIGKTDGWIGVFEKVGG